MKILPAARTSFLQARTSFLQARSSIWSGVLFKHVLLNVHNVTAGHRGRKTVRRDVWAGVRSTAQEQRLNRLSTQAAMYVNGYQRDWYGFNKGALIGSFDGKFLGRDGVTEYEDMNEFGQAWQVRGTDPQLFQTIEGPQYPEKCAMPEMDGPSVSRRLGTATVTDAAARKACSHVPKDDFQNCVSDVLGMDDITAAEAY